jgi:uncharacterized protein (DUF2236 family)
MTVSEPLRHVERAMSEPPISGRRPHRTLRLDDTLMGMALLLGPANVIMQLARPGVGYGVMESRVDSGRIDLHPIKRARTTFTYLAVAMAGTDTQKAAFRRAVNRAHAQVYSTPDSPVQYNAFDLDLQLWVAACLYKGGVDFYRTFIGEMDDADADRHYQEAVVLGSTLQVPPQMWPPDRAAFDRYWNEQLDKVHIDDAVRDYLYPIAVGRIQALRLPDVLRRQPEKLGLLLTAGFLPQRFRDEMQFAWNPATQRRFDRVIAVLRTINNAMPRCVRRFPFNLLLWDLDRRIKAGRPLV